MPTGEIEWLEEILGSCPGGPPISYLGRPSSDDLQLLLPTGPPAAAAASLRRRHSGRSLTEELLGAAGRSLGRAGLLRLAPGNRLTLAQFELVDHLTRVLGEPSLLAAVTLGPRRRNRKPVLQLIRPDGRTVGFAKVGWSTLSNELVANEVEVLRELEGRLPPAVIAPSVLHHERWRGRQVAVTTALLAPALAWGRAVPVAESIRTIAAVEPAGRWPVRDLDLVAQWRRSGLGEVVDLDRVVTKHGGVELEVGLWHGDLTPWNTASQARSLLVWDWELAGRGRPVGFDALHRRFEQHRRRRGGSNGGALAVVVDRAGEILEPLDLGLVPAQLAAMVDLYLCELIGREVHLSGQRWPAGELAGLGPAAATVLDRRIGAR